MSKESIAMSLAHCYITAYLKKESLPTGLKFMQRIEYMSTQSPEKERIEVLQEVIDQLTSDFGSWRTPWGEINRYQRLDGKVRQEFDDTKPSIPVGMASGNWGALAAYGARYFNNTKRIYGTRGNSFIAVVEFGDQVQAKTLLAGGQSGDPSSPHFDDQAQRYADVQFKDVPFYRSEVEKRGVTKYHPGAQPTKM